ncbi:hypothetical protein [Thioalkalivibrio sp. ALE12]|uniref:hypothetical protein n=1 Tax=Thioalkalivibrio sp. ALE12 TaxID=1158170 RepID=UPI0012DFB5C7|nr:hypothetical protein [Thioalkalivibrio sp. ALE12]
MPSCKTLLIALALVVATTSSSGCSLIPERTVYETVALPVPAEPDYPRIPAAELECLTDESYEALVRRDMLKSRYIGQLRAVIESTQ